MPKAKPLPDDQAAREKVLREREQSKKYVAAWRKRNQEAARLMTRQCVQLHRARAAMRKQRKALQKA